MTKIEIRRLRGMRKRAKAHHDDNMQCVVSAAYTLVARTTEKFLGRAKQKLEDQIIKARASHELLRDLTTEITAAEETLASKKRGRH